MTSKKIILALVASALVMGPASAVPAFADDDQAAIEAQIAEKNKMLETIQAQKRELERQLDETSQSNKKLSDEIKRMDTTIRQLNASIRENQVTIEKLNLEITSLGADISSTEGSIQLKKATIAKLVSELQQKDDHDLFSIFFNGKNLSESVAEAQSIESLSESLRNNLQELNALKGTLSSQLAVQKDKKETHEEQESDLKNRQVIVADEKAGRQDLLKVTKNQEKIYQQKLTELEKLQQDVASEIERMEASLRKRIDSKTLPGKGVLENPVPGAKLTQGYGATAFAKSAYKGQYHNGIDLGAPVGTPILAAEGGRVIASGDQDAYCRGGAYGKYVLIKHENGLTTLYGHMSRIAVSTGQTISRGQTIGYVGKTGYATGPHLHFTVFATNTIPPGGGGFPEGTQASRVCGPMPVGGDVNPLQYLSL
jgi:murein DD-endopeptidase MepM/ murein hydrolase activator NlpD